MNSKLSFYEQLKKSHEDNGSFSFPIGEYWRAQSVIYSDVLYIEVRSSKGNKVKKFTISQDGTILTYYGYEISSYVSCAVASRIWDIKGSFKNSTILKNL